MPNVVYCSAIYARVRVSSEYIHNYRYNTNNEVD